MGKRYVTIVIVACLGIITILSLQGSPRIAQVLAPMDTAQNPINAVETFYTAVERGDWLIVRASTSPDYWEQLESKGQVETWRKLFTQDQSLKFKGFTVQESRIEENRAVIKGWVQWVSSLGDIPRSAQTITLEEGLGGWRISSIQSK